uniref:DUF4149 domain-containing protein n=1 Tax=Pseudomonas phage RVTF4 TaxID=3236931 RepID=A0AB39CCX0_9VIRU
MIYWILEAIYTLCFAMVCTGITLTLVMLPLMAHKVETPMGHEVRKGEKETLYAAVKIAGYGIVGMLLIYAGMSVHILVTFQEILNASAF